MWCFCKNSVTLFWSGWYKKWKIYFKTKLEWFFHLAVYYKSNWLKVNGNISYVSFVSIVVPFSFFSTHSIINCTSFIVFISQWFLYILKFVSCNKVEILDFIFAPFRLFIVWFRGYDRFKGQHILFAHLPTSKYIHLLHIFVWIYFWDDFRLILVFFLMQNKDQHLMSFHKCRRHKLYEIEHSFTNMINKILSILFLLKIPSATIFWDSCHMKIKYEKAIQSKSTKKVITPTLK